MKTYTPDWNDMLGIAKKLTWKNLWRLEALGYEYDDALQECFIKFMQCSKQTYETQKHFCTYYVTALQNHFNTLSKTSSKKHQGEFFADEIFINILSENSQAYFILEPQRDVVKEVLRNAPTDLQRVVNILINLPNDFLGNLLQIKQGKLAGKLSNSLLCSLVGVDSNKVNLRTQLLKYFR